MQGFKELHHYFPRITFVGGGNMVQALAGGASTILDPAKVVISSPSLCSGTKKFPFPYKIAKNNCDAVENADLIVFGFKPKDAEDVCKEIAPFVPKDAIIASMLAGTPISVFHKHFGPNAAISRLMPNTGVLNRLGIIGLYHNPYVPKDSGNAFKALLETIGIVVPLKQEEDLNPFTAVFGSGPAYEYILSEYLDEAAEALDLMDATTRHKCLIQLKKGAAAVLANSTMNFQEARRQVTSPNGTTFAAVSVLEEGNLKALVKKALFAANKRAWEMGQPPKDTVVQMSMFQPEPKLETKAQKLDLDDTKRFKL